MYPTDLPEPTDVAPPEGVASYVHVCPDCGSAWSHPDTPHGGEGDRSLTGLLCTVAAMVAALRGEGYEDQGDGIDPDDAASILADALDRFRSTPEGDGCQDPVCLTYPDACPH